MRYSPENRDQNREKKEVRISECCQQIHVFGMEEDEILGEREGVSWGIDVRRNTRGLLNGQKERAEIQDGFLVRISEHGSQPE